MVDKNVIISTPAPNGVAEVIKLPSGVENGPYVVEGRSIIITPGSSDEGTYYGKTVHRVAFDDIIATVDGQDTGDE
jgi:hypothetical protein